MSLRASRKYLIKRCISLIIFVFALILPASLSLRAEHPPVKTYQIADGLPSDTVNKIKQDSRGFLWLLTEEGISRFDGYGFLNLTAADGLPSSFVSDFLEARDGTIYLATGRGLARLNPMGLRTRGQGRKAGSQNSAGALFSSILPEDSKELNVQVLFQDPSGTIYAGAADGLYQLNSQDDRLEKIDLGQSRAAAKRDYVTAIVKDRRGALWLATEGDGVLRLGTDGQIAQFTAAEGLPGNNVASLMEDRDGNLWAGMRLPATAGLVLLNPDATVQNPIVRRAFTIGDGLPSHWVPSIYQASDGQLWLGTVAGLCEWQGTDAKSVCRTYTGANDLCDKDVWSVTEDKDGNLWTGSSCGAKKLARYGFTAYSEADGVAKGKINSIFEDNAGKFLAAFRDNGRQTLYRFENDGKFTSVRPNLQPEVNYFSWGTKQTVWQDSDGAWLIPTSTGLYKFLAGTKFEDLATARPQKFSPATKGEEVFRVFEDSHGNVWIGTIYGINELWCWERGKNLWHDYTAQIVPAPNRVVTSFVEDQSGNLWIGTGADKGGELIRYRDGQFKIFTEVDNLPAGSIRDLYVDKTGRLWIANSRSGLLRLDDVNAEQLTPMKYSAAEGLASENAYCITEDSFGRIYIGSTHGLDRLNPDTGQVENFTTADGLPSSFVRVAHRDRLNNLWFGTENGVARYIPEPERKRLPPVALITALRVNGEPQSVSVLGETEIPAIELTSDQRQISLDFLALGASLGENLKYEYRLNDSDWIPTAERTVNFANLASGAYHFEVRAATADRLVSLPAAASFTIPAPVYLRPWFLLAAAWLFGGLIFALYRYRVSRLLEMERMRTRIATDLHDDIGANLTKISILSEVAHQRLGAGTNDFNDGNLLENIAETSRESVSSMSDIVWAINPKKDSLADLTRRMRRYAEELLERREIHLEFNIPTPSVDLKLDATLRRNIYLIFKESLNNIVRHADAENVSIVLRLETGKLLLEIADDGRGFQMTNESDGNGLASMQKRAAELGGTLEITSSPAEGTKNVLVLDVKRQK